MRLPCTGNTFIAITFCRRWFWVNGNQEPKKFVSFNITRERGRIRIFSLALIFWCKSMSSCGLWNLCQLENSFNGLSGQI
jgi:hypothetical protein